MSRFADEAIDKPFPSRPARGRYQRKEHDKKAPDGFTVSGWRKISKEGSVLFQHGRRFHSILARYPGQWVYVEVCDGWGVNAQFYLGEPWKTYPIPMDNEAAAGES